jgi:hypothetical protein
MHKKHDFSADSLKLLLTNSAPALTNAVKTDITEIAAGNGYSAGGITIPATSSGQTSGNYKLVLTDTTITASGGAIANWRWAVLYNDTSATDAVIFYMDYGSVVTIASGESFLFDFDASAGVITL